MIKWLCQRENAQAAWQCGCEVPTVHHNAGDALNLGTWRQMGPLEGSHSRYPNPRPFWLHDKLSFAVPLTVRRRDNKPAHCLRNSWGSRTILGRFCFRQKLRPSASHPKPSQAFQSVFYPSPRLSIYLQNANLVVQWCQYALLPRNSKSTRLSLTPIWPVLSAPSLQITYAQTSQTSRLPQSIHGLPCLHAFFHAGLS